MDQRHIASPPDEPPQPWTSAILEQGEPLTFVGKKKPRLLLTLVCLFAAIRV
ncbi:MAG: hypothetical protein SNJ59_15220 [Aggregatilineales bacterium]